MKEYSEISFKVYKEHCANADVWNKLTDFRLLWVRDWNMLFELQIDLTESSETVKTVQARALGEAELSQINLYGIEINTEDDIARDDYKVTTLYNENDAEASLLNRIMEKVPHYEIGHVDGSIANIQRSFSFDGTSLYDAFQEIAEEIQCLFIIECNIDGETGKISRKIKVKDLLSHCNNSDCGERGDFIDKCSKCGGTDITLGYGTDTAVFVSKDNLADEITYTTDCDKVKNCFRLEAGDDLMTATIANCNPNGSSYIWHFSDKIKEDMSDDLKDKLTSYDETYEIYQKTKELLSGFSDYNNKVESYNEISSEKYEKISDPITGYPNLMQAYYNVVDFRLFLESGLMPSVEMIETSASAECSKLSLELSNRGVAVQTGSLASKTTIESAIKQLAKTIIDNRYEIEIISDSSNYSETTKEWTGKFKVSNVANEEDTSTSSSVTVNVTDDIGTYTQQRIDKLLEKKVTSSDSATDVKALFQKNASGSFVYNTETQFKAQIKKYSLSRLLSFHDACQACLDILIEQGFATDEDSDNYKNFYKPYYERLGWLAAEIKTRESDISVVKNTEERILNKRAEIQKELNLETCLGKDLWKELMSFRREDTYSNNNYISDGLTNEELLKNAQDFISVAQDELYKSSTLQHTISSTLKNLLFMKEFSPIVDNFEVGNWIRVKIDGKVYRLRLLEYEINFESPENISVTFSDVTETKTGVSDIESILNQASSMATSYETVTRQSRVGKDVKETIDGWVKDGLSLTNQKIINNADDQQVTMDSHGLLCREYLPITDTYDNRQLKLINRGLYLTNDNWVTAKAGIGEFTYKDPETREEVSAYGVIADTIVGKIILSEKVGIYNSDNSVKIDQNGFVITLPNSTSEDSNIFTIRKDISDNGTENYEDIFNVTKSGNLQVKGDITATSLKLKQGCSIENEKGSSSDNYYSGRIVIRGYEADKIGETTKSFASTRISQGRIIVSEDKDDDEDTWESNYSAYRRIKITPTVLYIFGQGVVVDEKFTKIPQEVASLHRTSLSFTQELLSNSVWKAYSTSYDFEGITTDCENFKISIPEKTNSNKLEITKEGIVISYEDGGGMMTASGILFSESDSDSMTVYSHAGFGFINNEEAKVSSFKALGCAYQPGDKISIRTGATFPAFITSSQKEIKITIPISRPIMDVSSVTISGTFQFRGVSSTTGLLNNKKEVNMSTANLKISVIEGVGLYINITFSDKIENEEGTGFAINNTPVVASVSSASMTITFA